MTFSGLHTDRRTNGKTDRQMGRWTKWYTDIQTGYRQVCKETADRQEDRQAIGHLYN